jgi:hypothetical protein
MPLISQLVIVVLGLYLVCGAFGSGTTEENLYLTKSWPLISWLCCFGQWASIKSISVCLKDFGFTLTLPKRSLTIQTNISLK